MAASAASTRSLQTATAAPSAAWSTRRRMCPKSGGVSGFRLTLGEGAGIMPLNEGVMDGFYDPLARLFWLFSTLH